MSSGYKRPRRAVGDGQLVGMDCETDTGNALINHTVRHWLAIRSPDPDLGELDAVRFSKKLRSGAWSASACRQQLYRRTAITRDHLVAAPHGSRALIRESRWWELLVRPVIIETHDRGYFRAYLSLVRRAGLPGQRGSRGWRRVSKDKKGLLWELTAAHGHRVSGHWMRTDKLFHVTSARGSGFQFDKKRRALDADIKVKRTREALRISLGLRR